MALDGIKKMKFIQLQYLYCNFLKLKKIHRIEHFINLSLLNYIYYLINILHIG